MRRLVAGRAETSLAERLLRVPAVDDAALRERGRFLAAFALVSVPVALVAALTVPLWLAHPRPGLSLTALGAFMMAVGAAVAYGLNRAGRYRAAALVFVATALVTVTVAAFDSPDLLLFLPMATLSAVALLPARFAASVGVVAIVVAIPIGVRHSEELARVVLAASLNVFFLPLALVVNWHQNLVAAIRREEIARRERWFSTTLSSIGDAVLTTDATEHVTFLNPIAEKLTGFGLADALGRPVHEVFSIVHEHTGDAMMGPIREVLRARRILSLANHTVLLSRDGTARPIADSGAPILSESGELHGAVLVFRDITEERTLRAQLEHSQRLDSLGRLAGAVAHDFNNLLTVISSGTQLAIDGLRPDAQARSELEDVLGATERAVGVTRQLLAFSRRQVMQLSSVDLNAAVERSSGLFQRLLGSGVAVRLELAPDAGIVVVDPVQLEQVLMNLIVNANDAMPSGGTLTLGTARTTLAEGHERRLAAGDYGVLTVTDTGVGMEPHVVARVFEPFFTTKEHGHGTGLGLATTYGIVEQSQGTIRVKSRPGTGTTFEVLLPAAAASHEVRPPSPESTRERKATAATLLVVEDEDAVRRVIVRVLSLDGYEILEADCASKALELLRARPGGVDLLLTDVMMPGQSGVELARAARTSFPRLPVLYMSGFANADLAKQGVREDDAAFLPKPFTPDGLRTAVLKAMAQN